MRTVVRLKQHRMTHVWLNYDKCHYTFPPESSILDSGEKAPCYVSAERRLAPALVIGSVYEEGVMLDEVGDLEGNLSILFYLNAVMAFFNLGGVPAKLVKSRS